MVYFIVGDGRYRQTLETLVGQAGVGDSVVLTGEVRDVSLQQIYALCDLFVMPSREQLDQCDVEGFGMVYLEANACGKAVIGGRSGGIADAIIDGQTGLLVDPHSPEAIAEALDRLLSNQTLASHMGAQGRARIIREFTWTQVAGRIQGILSTLTATP
jgi:phosphatidyl-myo-inositol dimannoside synthase